MRGAAVFVSVIFSGGAFRPRSFFGSEQGIDTRKKEFFIGKSGLSVNFQNIVYHGFGGIPTVDGGNSGCPHVVALLCIQ
mgnify:FL=1